MAVNAFLTFMDKADGATDYEPTESLAVDPTNPNTGDEGPDKLTGYSGDDWTLDFQPELTTEPTAPADERSAPSVSEITVTKVTDSTNPLSEVDHNEFRIIKLVDATTDFQPQLTTEPTDAGAVAGIIIAATSDNNRVAIDDGADVLTTEPTEPTAPAGEDNHSEFVIVKLLDSATDFQPELTTEPTAPEAGKVSHNDAASELKYEMGFAPDAFDFTTEPTAPAMGDFDNNGYVDGRDFLVWQRGSSPAEVQELNQISENINKSGTQYNEPDDTDLSFAVEILGIPATMTEYGILLAI